MDPTMKERLDAFIKATYVEEPEVYCQLAPQRHSVRVDDETEENGQAAEQRGSVSGSVLAKNDISLPPLEKPFNEYLMQLIREKGLSEVDVYKKANFDRRLFSKIRRDKDYTPNKSTILTLIIAMELNITEARELLSRAGYALSRARMEDVIVEFFISAKQYDFYIINEALQQHNLPLLGG